MRIAIDAHAIGSSLTGNERYISNLAEQLLALDRENEYIFFFSREEVRRRWESRAPNLSALLVSPNPFQRLGLDFVRQLRRLHPQVFHYQYTGPLFSVAPEIVTIHDVSFERHPEFYGRAQCFQLRRTVRRAARVARKIITVSEFSRQEIVHFLKVPPDKVKVIYNGVGPEFRPITDKNEVAVRLQRYKVRRPYLLAVGNISRRKNQVAMLQGFARWRSRHPAGGHQLVIVGKPQERSYAKRLFAEAQRLGLAGDRLTILGYAPEEDLPYIYAGADLLLSTSVYEGFGLPLIEAMRCGVPVIASRASCFPEIAQFAAKYVDPQNPEEIAQAIEDVLDNETLRSELIQRGLQRAQSFRWDVAARETLGVYYDVVGELNRPSLRPSAL